MSAFGIGRIDVPFIYVITTHGEHPPAFFIC